MAFKNRKEADYFQEKRADQRAQKAVKNFKNQVAKKHEERLSRHATDNLDDDFEDNPYAEYADLVK